MSMGRRGRVRCLSGPVLLAFLSGQVSWSQTGSWADRGQGAGRPSSPCLIS